MTELLNKVINIFYFICAYLQEYRSFYELTSDYVFFKGLVFVCCQQREGSDTINPIVSPRNLLNGKCGDDASRT